MTIRGGGNPHTAMAAMPLGEWTRRLGALLAEAYDCFMVGTLHGSTEYKRGSRAIARGQWQAPPRIIAWQTTRSRAVCRRARVGQGQAFGGAEEAPSLTLAARDGDGQYAVGAEECSRRGSNKRINKQGRDKMVCTTLDKESPIQAVCPNWARTDLCGGRGVTRVPTANINQQTTPAESVENDPGCVKTPTSNLRVESLSRLRSIREEAICQSPSEEEKRENNSARSPRVHVFTQPGPHNRHAICA